MKKLDDEVNAWEYERNSIGATVRWRFNKDNARVETPKALSQSAKFMFRCTSFGLKSSQFILFPISTNLSPNSLIRSYSWRIAKSVRFLMTNYIVYIIFIDYDLIRFFGIHYGNNKIIC